MVAPYSSTIVDSAGELLAIIVRETAGVEGVHFVTPDDLQQQVAVMGRPADYVIPAHTHLPVPRSLRGTQEVLIVKSGEMEVSVFDANRSLVAQELIRQGDILILVSGGHGFRVLSDCEFVEVKQGPYVPGRDKEVFDVGSNQTFSG